MSSLGKGIRSIRKKDLQTQKSMGTGVKKLVFYHKASSGDTTINLLTLSMPTELSTLGKTNPSAAAIGAAKLFFYQDNFTLVSSLHGILMPGSFVITSSTQIQLQYSAAANEIFIGYLDNIIQPSLRAVDARTLNATGTLSVGSTDFAVGDVFVTNQYSNTQIGAVLVFRNGKIQFRNTANAVASPSADGNYQEVPTSGPTGNLIRFNIATPGPADDVILVVSNGALVERPNDSQMALIENLSGQINSMIPVLADAAGVPTSTFGSNPSPVDLRTFGDTAIANGNRITTLEGIVGQYFSQVSSIKTPVATSQWHALSGNSVTLTAGIWLLNGACVFNSSGTSPTYAYMIGQWSIANGADSGTQPTALTTDAGLPTSLFDTSPVNSAHASMPAVRKTITSPLTVYLVTYAVMTTAANARISTYIYAQRIG